VFVFLPVSLLPALLTSYVPLSIGSRTGQRAVQSLIILVVMVPAGVVGMLMLWAQQKGFFWPIVAVEAVVMIGLYILMLRVVAWRAVTGRRPRPVAEQGNWSTSG
jgi:undecaprenyl pyrophosphate phosphatase UppP